MSPEPHYPSGYAATAEIQSGIAGGQVVDTLLKTGAKACEMCGKTQSPEWRKGPSGEKTLCNACGLRFSRSQKRKKPDSGREE